MKRFSLGTVLTLGILSFGSAAFTGQPVGTPDSRHLSI